MPPQEKVHGWTLVASLEAFSNLVNWSNLGPMAIKVSDRRDGRQATLLDG
jgi:hypothetical protein